MSPGNHGDYGLRDLLGAIRKPSQNFLLKSTHAAFEVTLSHCEVTKFSAW